MSNFVHEDGQGNLYNDEGFEVNVVEMDVDQDMYPVEMVTNFNIYRDIKPSEKEIKAVAEKPKKVLDSEGKQHKTYQHYKDTEKEQLLDLVINRGMSARAAAMKLNIKPRIAQIWVKNDQEDPQPYFERKEGSGRPVGRPPKLGGEHEKFLVDLVDDQPSLVLDQIMDNLTNHFTGLSISKTGLYKFVTDKCRISLKRAHFHSVDRNSPDKIEARFDWVTKWNETDMDYMSNCVFIDEAAFHINMKRSFAWSKVGTRAVVPVPKTRARTTTILGAICPAGVVNITVRRPKAQVASKKRKTTEGSSSTAKKNTGTVTGHYFNFISSTMDIMDKHEQFKGYYLIMDNAPIHTNDNIQKYIESRGYGCVYLPPYSPELNPIEQFWSVCKSKLKRVPLLDEETLTTRIGDACNQTLYSDLKGFSRYSVAKFQDCLDRNPI
jgi:transposase